jgi:YHS domain-containing protein
MKHHRLWLILLAAAFVFVVAAAARQKAGDTAIDPVCGMTVKKADAKATYEYKGTTYYFCCSGCKDAFVKDPEKYLQKTPAQGQAGMMMPGQGRMMHQGMMGQGMGGGCPMTQGGAANGCCMMGPGLMHRGMMGRGMMRQGLMGQGWGANCPVLGQDVERTVENTPQGVTVKLTSKDPETVKKLQEHFARMDEWCRQMKGQAQKETPKEEKK